MRVRSSNTSSGGQHIIVWTYFWRFLFIFGVRWDGSYIYVIFTAVRVETILVTLWLYPDGDFFLSTVATATKIKFPLKIPCISSHNSHNVYKMTRGQKLRTIYAMVKSEKLFWCCFIGWFKPVMCGENIEICIERSEDRQLPSRRGAYNEKENFRLNHL